MADWLADRCRVGSSRVMRELRKMQIRDHAGRDGEPHLPREGCFVIEHKMRRMRMRMRIKDRFQNLAG